MSYITLGLTYKWVSDGQILMYEPTSVSVYVIIEWAQHVMEMLSKWPENKPIQILFNLSHPKVSVPFLILTNRDIFNIGVTDLGKVKVQQILIKRGNLFGRLAILLPASSSGLMVQNHARSSMPVVESRMFTDYDTAVAWLTDTHAISQKFSQTRNLNVSEEVLRQYAVQDNPSIIQAQQKLGLVFNGTTKLIEFEPNQPLVVGRQDFDVHIFGEHVYTVSRLHVHFYFEKFKLYLIDLESTNGTYLNGTRVEPKTKIPISVGDEIRIGTIPLRLVDANDQ